MCCMVSGSPQLQFGLVAWPHRTRLTAHRPCPIRNRFSIDQCRRGRSKPGGQTDGSATRKWFTTSVAAHSSLHAELAIISSGGGSSQTGFLNDMRAAGCSVMSELSGNLSFAWTLVSSLAVASCRRRCGGGMLLRTGSHGSGVERRVRVIVHIDVFN